MRSLTSEIIFKFNLNPDVAIAVTISTNRRLRYFLSDFIMRYGFRMIVGNERNASKIDGVKERLVCERTSCEDLHLSRFEEGDEEKRSVFE